MPCKIISYFKAIPTREDGFVSPIFLMDEKLLCQDYTTKKLIPVSKDFKGVPCEEQSIKENKKEFSTVYYGFLFSDKSVIFDTSLSLCNRIIDSRKPLSDYSIIEIAEFINEKLERNIEIMFISILEKNPILFERMSCLLEEIDIKLANKITSYKSSKKKESSLGDLAAWPISYANLKAEKRSPIGHIRVATLLNVENLKAEKSSTISYTKRVSCVERKDQKVTGIVRYNIQKKNDVEGCFKTRHNKKQK